jgi:hypothetical protein
MTILLIIFGWWLSGVLCILLSTMIHKEEIKVKELPLLVVSGWFGPFVLFLIFMHLTENSEKVIISFKKKEETK